jgi:hypothetical protein
MVRRGKSDSRETNDRPSKRDQANRQNSSRSGRRRIFNEAAGKIIDSMHYTCDPPDWQALEIRFTDGTVFSFELLPRVDLRCQDLKTQGSDLQIIRSYDIPTDDE